MRFTAETIRVYNQVCDEDFTWDKLSKEQRQKLTPLMEAAEDTGLWPEIFDSHGMKLHAEDFDLFYGNSIENIHELQEDLSY